MAAVGSDQSRFLTRMGGNFKLWAKTDSFKVCLSGYYLFYCGDRKHIWDKGINHGCTVDITNTGIQKVNLTGMWLKYKRELIRERKESAIHKRLWSDSHIVKENLQEAQIAFLWVQLMYWNAQGWQAKYFRWGRERHEGGCKAEICSGK